jgi:hypothetical protein
MSIAYDVSVLRRTATKEQIEAVAARLADRANAELLTRQRDDGWINGIKHPGAARDFWAHSQAVTAIFRSAKSLSQLPIALHNSPDLMFSEGAKVGPNALGWKGQDGESFTRVEPALWALSAVALKHRKGGKVSEAYYRYLTSVLHHYYAGGGAWNLGPDQQPGGDHSVYESALAAMALLDARAAGDKIEINGETLDQVLEFTARWLVRQYVRVGNFRGWGDGEDAHIISYALSSQVYAVLIRADLEAGVPLDPAIYYEAGLHVSDYRKTPLEHVRFTAVYASPEGGKIDVQTLVSLEPISRTVECAALWLQRAARDGNKGPQERLVQKILDSLVYHDGDATVQAAIDQPSYQLALWLNASAFTTDYLASNMASSNTKLGLSTK